MEEELLKILEEAREEYDIAWNNLPLGLDYKEYQEALEPFVKKCAIASRNYRMVKTPILKDDVPDFGDVMSLEHFISCCKLGGFIDYDGDGEYIKDGKLSGITIRPSDIKHNAVRKEFNQIVWFNR